MVSRRSDADEEISSSERSDIEYYKRFSVLTVSKFNEVIEERWPGIEYDSSCSVNFFADCRNKMPNFRYQETMFHNLDNYLPKLSDDFIMPKYEFMLRRIGTMHLDKTDESINDKYKGRKIKPIEVISTEHQFKEVYHKYKDDNYSIYFYTKSYTNFEKIIRVSDNQSEAIRTEGLKRKRGILNSIHSFAKFKVARVNWKNCFAVPNEMTEELIDNKYGEIKSIISLIANLNKGEKCIDEMSLDQFEDMLSEKKSPFLGQITLKIQLWREALLVEALKSHHRDNCFLNDHAFDRNITLELYCKGLLADMRRDERDYYRVVPLASSVLIPVSEDSSINYERYFDCNTIAVSFNNNVLDILTQHSFIIIKKKLIINGIEVDWTDFRFFLDSYIQAYGHVLRHFVRHISLSRRTVKDFNSMFNLQATEYWVLMNYTLERELAELSKKVELRIRKFRRRR